MIRITFIDGEHIDISRDTTLIGINNSSRNKRDETFYLQQEYNSIVDNGLSLLTTDERLGITGFILSFDCFTLGESENETIYLKSAVKSISVI
ncbi:hypothetical protein GC105_11575 [Alkalibaculum sp. M08DMB]|uniref:Uncharacterized protein n=1 Tax=Alkalibaculum sporogenes TaxID=2655001 RepID=A0A6A7KA62_9FIRM|nr:hypothetical protein [Alkalibaculum sporogenes]MPW26429.1 hypothetical protein [Alkalibaculum sporogenes]